MGEGIAPSLNLNFDRLWLERTRSSGWKCNQHIELKYGFTRYPFDERLRCHSSRRVLPSCGILRKKTNNPHYLYFVTKCFLCLNITGKRGYLNLLCHQNWCSGQCSKIGFLTHRFSPTFLNCFLAKRLCMQCYKV